jgi:trimeric autotransporter adhesin
MTEFWLTASALAPQRNSFFRCHPTKAEYMSFSKRSRIFAGATLVLLGATALPANAQQDQRRPRPPEPTISIGDASIVEGNSGRQNLVFTVTLSEPSNRQVRADWRTRTGTANNRDFRADDGTVRFRNGATTATISVAINGDTAVEPDETFTVVLRDPDRATVADATATGTIVNDDGVDVVTLSSIAVTPAGPTTMIKGSSVQFTATGSYSDGTTANVSSQVTWASSGPAVGINAAGLATANSVGNSSVTATIGSVTSAGTAITVSAATLRSIAVTPATATVAAGLTQQFVATGSYSDGTSAPIATATWSTSSSESATVTASGLAKGLSAGEASITASVSGVSSPAATLTVTPATVVSVAITKGLETYDTTQYTATATYTDGSTSTNATWASSDSGVGFVTPLLGEFSKGAVGSTTLTATIGGVSKALVVVVDKRISGITLSPEAASIPKGKTQQLVLTAQFNDGTFLPITSGVTFASDSANATVSNTGLVTATSSEGLAVITALNTASYLSSGVSVSKVFTATTNMTTTPAVVTAISSVSTKYEGALVPGNIAVQYSAIGTYSDGTSGDVTSQVTWSATNGTIDAAGVFTGNNPTLAVPGNATPAVISATLGTASKTATLSVLSNAVQVTLQPKFGSGNPAQSDEDLKVLKVLVIASLANGEKYDLTGVSTFEAVGNSTGWTIGTTPETKGEAYAVPGSLPIQLRGTVVGTPIDAVRFFEPPFVRVELTAPRPSTPTATFTGPPVLNVGGVPSLLVGASYDLVGNSKVIDWCTAGLAPAGTFCATSNGGPPFVQVPVFPSRSYTSSNLAVGTINSSNQFVAVGPGTTDVTFTIANPYSNGGLLTVTKTFTVRRLDSIQLLVPQTQLPSAQTMVTHTIAFFDNGLTAEVSLFAVLTSDDYGRAAPYPFYNSAFYPAPTFNAYVLGQNAGAVTITSSFLSLTSAVAINTRPRIAYVTLRAASVSLFCPSADQVRMTATLVDETTADMTGLDRVTFETSNPRVVTVSNSWLNPGRLTKVSEGTAMIGGRYFYYDNGSFTEGVYANPIAITYPCGTVPSV